MTLILLYPKNQYNSIYTDRLLTIALGVNCYIRGVGLTMTLVTARWHSFPLSSFILPLTAIVKGL